jgi:hypothetical protein
MVGVTELSGSIDLGFKVALCIWVVGVFKGRPTIKGIGNVPYSGAGVGSVEVNDSDGFTAI